MQQLALDILLFVLYNIQVKCYSYAYSWILVPLWEIFAAVHTVFVRPSPVPAKEKTMNKLALLSQRALSAVDKRIDMLDKVAAVLLAFCPLLQHYTGLIYNAGLTVMVLLVPYLLLRLYMKRKEFRLSNLWLVAALVVYMVYRIIDHGTSLTELGQSGVLIVIFIAAAMGCIDVKTICKAAALVAILASLVMAVQYVCYYLFDFHLQMVPTDQLISSAKQWAQGAKDGLTSINGIKSKLYRPSAFFLEPSHFFFYAFPHLFLLLFSGKNKWYLVFAAIISLGMVLSTSGMGIGTTGVAWIVFFALWDAKTNSFSIKNILRVQNLVLLAILAAVVFFVYENVPTVQQAISRIFIKNGKQTAISGRTAEAIKALKKMSPLQWAIGVKDTTHGYAHNMPGLIAAIYRHGLIGGILSMEFYTKSVYKLKLPYALTAVMILVVSMFSAHTHSTVGFMYMILILMRGHHYHPITPEPCLFPYPHLKKGKWDKGNRNLETQA